MSTDRPMPFGKYKGQMLSDIPVPYLDWLIGQEFMKEKKLLSQQILAHLETRPEWKRMEDDDD